MRAAAQAVEVETAEVDDQPSLAGRQQPRRQGAADALVHGFVVAPAAEADQQDAAGGPTLVDEGLGDRGQLALESLGVGGPGGERARRLAKPDKRSEIMSSLQAGMARAKAPSGRTGSEADLEHFR
jgi:hypothetical protein